MHLDTIAFICSYEAILNIYYTFEVLNHDTLALIVPKQSVNYLYYLWGFRSAPCILRSYVKPIHVSLQDLVVLNVAWASFHIDSIALQSFLNDIVFDQYPLDLIIESL